MPLILISYGVLQDKIYGHLVEVHESESNDIVFIYKYKICVGSFSMLTIPIPIC